LRTWPAVDVGSGLNGPDADLIHAALVDHEVAAVDEDAARVFFHTAGGRDTAVAALQRQFPALRIEPVDVPDEDWAARSQANLKAVRVGDIIVAPPWDVPAEAPEGQFRPAADIVIVIQPSMGFGTGHHATTRLCLSHLQHLDLRGRSALDVGTGSGLLAIAASRRGASPVLAIDDDPDAIASARENLDLNPATNVTLGTLDLRRATLRPFDLVLANLTGGLLAGAAAALVQLVTYGGGLVLSGFMQAEEPGVLAAFASCTIVERSQEDEWVCVTLSRSR
jgi:ribosomal protein L11 methyltransferase